MGSGCCLQEFRPHPDSHSPHWFCFITATVMEFPPISCISASYCSIYCIWASYQHSPFSVLGFLSAYATCHLGQFSGSASDCPCGILRRAVLTHSWSTGVASGWLVIPAPVLTLLQELVLFVIVQLTRNFFIFPQPSNGPDVSCAGSGDADGDWQSDLFPIFFVSCQNEQAHFLMFLLLALPLTALLGTV